MWIIELNRITQTYLCNQANHTSSSPFHKLITKKLPLFDKQTLCMHSNRIAILWSIESALCSFYTVSQSDSTESLNRDEIPLQSGPIALQDHNFCEVKVELWTDYIDADLLLTVMLTTITLMKTKLQIGVRLKLQECHCQILFRKIHCRIRDPLLKRSKSSRNIRFAIDITSSKCLQFFKAIVFQYCGWHQIGADRF
jgi:hypothetical protein